MQSRNHLAGHCTPRQVERSWIFVEGCWVALQRNNKVLAIHIGSVDKFEPVPRCGEMDHAEEAACQLIVSGGDGAVDIELAEHAFDVVALLVERPVIVDFHAAV